MTKKQILLGILAILSSITLVILLVIFDSHIISFFSQFKTIQTLLQYSDFWNQRLHDWLGDTITLVGVMLAFTLPFTAQVVQWIVSAYGVNSFPEMIKDKLKINHLLKEMFIFVGVVIFWRVFIYDISPYTSSLYILFNIFILFSFIWILFRLFKVINYILKCTFSFQEFVVNTAYKNIESISNSIPIPFSNITDISIIPTLSAEYLQNLELLRDYEISKFKRGDIDISKKESFDYYIWKYITALLITNDLERQKQSIELQKKLSTSIVRMCVVSSYENYNYYLNFASRLAYYSIENRYFTLDKTLTNTQENIYYSFDDSFNDMIFLAENIESKKANVYYPVLSCQYLLNHSQFGYSFVLPKNISSEFDWESIFERINIWENEIIEVTKRLIQISSRYAKNSALEKVYDNLQNDLQFSHTREFTLPRTRSLFVYEEYEQIDNLNKINNEEEIIEYFKLISSDEFNNRLGFSPDEKKENLIKLLSIRYKIKVDKLILFWLRHLSFDTTIIIKILEKVSPIDRPKVTTLGDHLIPSSIGGVFKLYSISNDLEFNNFISNSDSDNYQIVFNTMILYFLAKDLRHTSAEDKSDPNQLASNIAKNIYSFNELTIGSVKSINEIAASREKQLKGIDSNQVIKDLCIHYGISFDDLKKLYTDVLVCLKNQSEEVINQKIIKAPIDEDAIAAFYKNVKESTQTLLNNHELKEYINNNEREKHFQLSINRAWFIKADTATYYDRKALAHIIYREFENFLKSNQEKTMVIFDGKTEPTVNLKYKKDDLKLIFYCKYNFYFK